MGTKLIKDETLQGIADAIRSKTGNSETIKTKDMAAAIDGISVGDSDLWFRVESIVASLQFRGFSEFETETVELTFDRLEAMTSIFLASAGQHNQLVKEVTINCPNKITSLSNCFDAFSVPYDYVLKKIVLNVDTSACTSFYRAFIRLASLEEISGTPLDFSSMTNTKDAIFTNCNALKEVRFKGSLSLSLSLSNSPLTKDSILSVMSVLSNDATDKTLSLKKTAINKAFETSEGANDGSESAEWNELVATKPNWTITVA